MADTTTQTTPPAATWDGAFEAFSTAFSRMQQSPEVPILYIGLYVAFGVVGGLAQHTSWDGQGRLSSAGGLLFFVFLLALPRYGLALADRRKLGLKRAFAPDVRSYVFVLLALILSGVIFALGAIPLLIPLIWFIPWFFFAMYAITDKRLSALEGLKYSRDIAKNHKGKIWALFGTTILLSIPAALVSIFVPYVGIAASALVSVLSSIASAQLYRWLEQQAVSLKTEADQAGDMRAVLQ